MNARTGVYAAESDMIYFDNAATTYPKPDIVYEFAYDFYRRYGGNAGRGNNPLARACARLLEETRIKLAAWLDAPSPEQVIFTSSATHALNLAILGHTFRRNDVVYVTPFEHNSVLRPLEHLRQTQGIQIQQIPFDRRTYACQLEELAISFHVEPPTMVCVTQASNVCGVMPPVIEIARLAKQTNPNAVIIVDGAQTAGLYPLPLRENLIDALIFSGHKSLYALYGIAGVVLGTTWRPQPLLFGGTGTVSESVQMPRELPSAYEAGSQNILAIAGLHAALSWLQETNREKLVGHTMQLAHKIYDELGSYPQIKMFGPVNMVDWCGIISFTVEGITPQAIETALGAANIAVRCGLHCSPWAHEWLKTITSGGTVRVSLAHFNTIEDVDHFLLIIRDLAISESSEKSSRRLFSV